MTKNSILALMQHLEYVFDIVRLVDVSLASQYVRGEHDQLVKLPYECHSVWKRGKRCDNCISAKVLINKSRLTKFEICEDEVYHVIAKYVEVEGTAYVLEMVSKITDEALFSAYGESEFAKTISYYNKKIFTDPLTNIYNRHYFEDQLKGIVNTSAVAMVDIDDFKRINDTYGHQIGDEALCKVAELILALVQDKGYVVRFGGDEFLIVFNEITKEKFSELLEAFRKTVYDARLPEEINIRLSISIGAVYCESSHENVIAEADRMLYVAKKEKNKVVLKQENAG